MAYEIPIDVGALDKLVERLEAAAKATTGLDANVKNLNSSLSQTRMKASSGGSSSVEGAATSGMAPGGGFDDYAYRRIRNEARAIQYKNEFGGGADPYTTYAARRIRNQEMRERFNSEMGGNTRAAALARTRVGPDGKLYPLMRDLGALGGLVPGSGAIAGAMGASGPLGIAAASVAGGVTAYKAILSNQSMVANSYFASGGTSGEVGRLAGMGNDAAGRAVAFGDTLRGGGMASGYFRSHGIIDRGAYQTNKATNYFKGIDVLRNEPNEGRAIRMAREAGLSEELRYRYMSPGLYGQITNNGSGPSAESIRNSANMQGNVELAQRQMNAGLGIAAHQFNRTFGNIIEGAASGNWGQAFLGLSNLDPRNWITGNVRDGVEGRGETPRKKLAEDTQPTGDPTYQFTGDRMQGGARAHGAANIGQAVGALNNRGLQDAMRIGAFPVY